jgi:hypothetical protein
LERLKGSPVIFLAFVLGETAEPECSGGECGGGKTSPRARASENKGLKCGSEKKCPLPVNGYVSINMETYRIIQGICLYFQNITE